MKFDIYTRLALILATIWSVLCFLFTYSAFNAGKNPFGEILFIQWGTFAIYAFLCGAFFRLVYSHYWFSFKSAFRYTLIMGIVGNALFFVMAWALLTWNWDTLREIYVDNMVSYMETTWQSGEMEKFGEVNEEGFKQKMKEIQQVTPYKIVFYDFTVKTFITLILSLIIAVVLRTSIPLKPNENGK